MRRALTIAGSDSGGGAGIQADLKTFAAFGLYGASAITAITAQNTLGITTMHALPADLVIAQIEAVSSDIRLDATKIGMLATAAIVEAVAASIQELDLPSVVLDPVLVSSSGERLLEEDGVQTLLLELLPRVRVVTPNVAEAEALSGRRIASDDDMRGAAERLHSMGAGAVIITGGHARSHDDVVVDLLFDGTSFVELKTARVATARGTHGTGCTYASALAAGLALGETLTAAALRAQQYVAGAIAHGVAVGEGTTLLDHFWQGIGEHRRA
ncbi:MAG TPA: bifunctional hydroxymethylpyrimidine kinase/phosphomethylpyrimidine kinase [Vicinamibacterales bacterium]|jgi:hydroxymethylpyrimidine/phosphomethylpyrimidine kinase|nr:bifunctional hydroxymethylpyrimidine kinase/phosphomethylpyrimidine kinase [Vicinamibacterales bacterium]